jgi:hypothetical protein
MSERAWLSATTIPPAAADLSVPAEVAGRVQNANELFEEFWKGVGRMTVQPDVWDDADEEEEDEGNTTCVDCGVATVTCAAPPHTPCSPEYGCAHDGTWEWYMLTDEIWALIGDPDCLCIGCVEKRLGRPLNASDFADLPINDPHRYDTPRLAAARSRTG